MAQHLSKIGCKDLLVYSVRWKILHQIFWFYLLFTTFFPEQTKETSQNPCSLETICLNNIIINFIKLNGKYVKDKVKEQITANRHKRKRGNNGNNYFSKVVFSWKEEMQSKLLSDIKEMSLPVFLYDSLSSRSATMLDHLYKWIAKTWYNFPLVSEINLNIFHFEHVFWRSNGTVHDRKTYISHLCYILENQGEVLECIKKRYSSTYASVLKLIIVHFEMRIHEKFWIPSTFSMKAFFKIVEQW